MKTMLLVVSALMAATPALAQSSDPSVGSGNVASRSTMQALPSSTNRGALAAYAQASPSGLSHRMRARHQRHAMHGSMR